MEIGIVRQINIDTEMQASYLDYAMSVIVARALPDVRDGLKPVHRRILYAMHDLGLQHDKPYKKSARIVGEVLGKYHPHGDAAVYEAMVRMAQDFSLRYPLVDGQGNFGSIDGDNAAAMRYTEARLASIAAEMLADIEKDTVDWVPNFDGTLKEPSVLPAALPNLIVNGSSGIAVGMSTSIPPHNLGEVCDALCYLIDNHRHIEDVTIEDLMRFIPGPDFPTGGVVYRYTEETNGGETEQVDVIAHAYGSGQGRIVLQAKAHIEEMTRNRSRIVVTELPYQTDKSNLLERIAELVRDGRLEGVTDLRDESDRTGMRVCIEMTRTVEPRQVLAELFRLTPLQSTFSVSLLALVDGEPRHLSLKRMLQHFIEHRQDVILRRSRYDLEKARQRAHILEGLLRALDILDEVIALIRRSRTADSAKQNLIEQFKFTEIQAQAILDMQLRRLAALERRKLEDEYRGTLALIKELEELLASPAKVLALIRRNLTDLKARYGDARRTQIADRTKGALTAKDVLPDQEVWVTLTTDGLLSRVARAGSRHPLLGSKEVPPWCVPVNTRQDLYLLSAKGQATRVPAYQVPDSVGAHYADISGLTRRDRVAALCVFPQSHGDEPLPGYLLLGTLRGKVKRVAMADVAAQAHTNPQVIGLDNGDELAWAGVSAGGGEFLLATANGQAIRFTEEDVRPMGLPAGGIGGIKLQGKDRVVGGCGIPAGADPGTSVAFLMAAGSGKRVPVTEFPVQGRNGQGVIAAKPTPRTGELAGAALVAPGDLLACLVSGGTVKVVPAAGLPETARANMGRAVLSLAAGQQVLVIYGAAGAGAEEIAAGAVAGSEPSAKKSRSAARTKPPAEEGTKAEKTAAPAAEPLAESGSARKPAAEGMTKPSKAGRKVAVVTASELARGATRPEAPSEAILAPGAPVQPTPPKRRPAAKPESIVPTAKTPSKAPAKTSQAQLSLISEPAAKTKTPAARKVEPVAKSSKGATAGKPPAPAAKPKAAPADEVSVKEMRGRSISRADLEKLIRGEISKLPQTFEDSETSKVSKPSALKQAPVAPAGKPSGKPAASKEPSIAPAATSKSGSESRKPPAEPAAPKKAKAETGPTAKPKPSEPAAKPSGTVAKPPVKPSGSASKAGPVKPASEPAKPPSPKPKSGTTTAKAPAAKKTKP